MGGPQHWAEDCQEVLEDLGPTPRGKTGMGYRGKKGGDLFVDQIDLIDHLKPYVVCLEMVPTALKVNQGWEVKTVLESQCNIFNQEGRASAAA